MLSLCGRLREVVATRGQTIGGLNSKPLVCIVFFGVVSISYPLHCNMYPRQCHSLGSHKNVFNFKTLHSQRISRMSAKRTNKFLVNYRRRYSSVIYCTAAQLEEVNKPRNASHETVSSTVRSSHDSRGRLPEDKNKRKLQIAIQQVVAVAYQL